MRNTTFAAVTGVGKGKVTFTAVRANAMAINLRGSFSMAERTGLY